MTHFKNSIVAPFVILNKYNPFNYHGQKDFGFKDIKEYLSRFPQEKAEELKNSTIPGLKELKEMADSTPHATREDLVRFKSQVKKMALHYLQNGSLREKLYIARDISGEILSQETKDQVLSILEKADMPIDVVREFFISKVLSKDRAVMHDLELSMLFDYLTRHKNPELLSLLKFNEGRLIDHFINKKELSIQDISALSKVFDERGDRIKEAINFARKQKGLNPEFHLSHHERSTEGTLSKLIRLTTDKEIHSLLEELFKCGYKLTTYQSGKKMGISEEELRTQTQILKEKLTDKTIDSLVDSVRLKRQDRENLKFLLKERRDYISTKFLS